MNEEEPEIISRLDDDELLALYRDRRGRLIRMTADELVERGRDKVQNPPDTYAGRRPITDPSYVPRVGPQPEETTPAFNVGEATRWQTPAASRPSRPSPGGMTREVSSRSLGLIVSLLIAAVVLLSLGLLEAYRKLSVPASYPGPLEMFVGAIVLMVGCVVTAAVG